MSTTLTALTAPETTTEAARAEELIGTVDRLLTTLAEWRDSTEWRVTPGLDLWDAILDTIDAFDGGMLPARLRRLSTIVVDELTPAWGRFENLRDESARPADEQPPEAVWKAIEAIAMARPSANILVNTTVESVKWLLDHNVDPRQVAEIYGWQLPNGQWDVTKVQEEYAEPGRHTKNWLNPIYLRKLQEQQSAIDTAAADNQTLERKRNRARAGETIADLIKQGLSATQIAEMHRTTVDAIFAEADRLDLPRPTVYYDVLGKKPAKSATEIDKAPTKSTEAEAKPKRGRPAKPAKPVDTSPEAPAAEMTDEQATIAELFADGKTPAEIAALLNITQSRVDAIIDNLG